MSIEFFYIKYNLFSINVKLEIYLSCSLIYFLFLLIFKLTHKIIGFITIFLYIYISILYSYSSPLFLLSFIFPYLFLVVPTISHSYKLYFKQISSKQNTGRQKLLFYPLWKCLSKWKTQMLKELLHTFSVSRASEAYYVRTEASSKLIPASTWKKAWDFVSMIWYHCVCVCTIFLTHSSVVGHDLRLNLI